MLYLQFVPCLLKAQIVLKKEIKIKEQQQPTSLKLHDNSILISGLNTTNSNLTKNGFIFKSNLNFDSVHYKTYSDTSEIWFWDLLKSNNKIYIVGLYNNVAPPYSSSHLFIVDEIDSFKIQSFDFGGKDGDAFYKILQYSDSTLFMLGDYSIPNTADSIVKVYVVKSSPNGNLQWRKQLGNFAFEEVFDARETKDKSLQMVGFVLDMSFKRSAISGNINRHGYVIKIDTAGNLLWEKHYTENDNGTTATGFNSLSVLKNGNTACAGYFWDDSILQSYRYYTEALLYLLDDTGGVLQKKRFLTDKREDKFHWLYSQFNKVIEEKDGNLLLLGTYQDLRTPNYDNVGFLIKYNPTLDTVFWRIEFRNLNDGFDAKDFALDINGTAYVVCYYVPYKNTGYTSDMYLVKIDNTGCLMDECHIGQPHYNSQVITIPNPFKDGFNVQFSDTATTANIVLFDILGRKVLEQTLTTNLTYEGLHYVSCDAAALANGMYLFILTANNKQIAKGKVVKQ